jgi:hypothetical protein
VHLILITSTCSKLSLLVLYKLYTLLVVVMLVLVYAILRWSYLYSPAVAYDMLGMS